MICYRCGQNHRNRAEEIQCERDARRTRYEVLALIVTIAIVILGIEIWWAHYAYDDWTCAFAHCRKLKP